LNLQNSAAYQRVQDKLSRQECIVLDGGVGTELQRQGVRDFRLSDSSHWGLEVLDRAPHAVASVHKSYVRAGCDVLTTNTYGTLDAPQRIVDPLHGRIRPVHWMDMARKAVHVAKDVIDGCGKTDECAVAFSIGGDVVSRQQLVTVQLLLRVFEDARPDLVLFETLSMMSDNHTRDAIELLLAAGIPVWLSFRRCRHGVCGIHGQLWGGPEGDYFGRLARELEAQGVGALLVNCLPPENISGVLPWLRDFTDLPLGCYPNLGRYLEPEWKFDETVAPEDFAELSQIWRAEGAQILGGCCGVGPDHIAAMADLLQRTQPGTAKPRIESGLLGDPPHRSEELHEASEVQDVSPWEDEQGRELFPLPMPEIVCDPDVFVPTQGSYLLWKHLFRTGLGRGKKCLDLGCGAGILSVQLALNGAEMVTAIDIQKEAVANTLTNAFRNGVSDRVRGDVVDLYAFDSTEPYDLVVASLYQMPTDPLGEFGSHRPVDYWGRNLLDHLITVLPNLMKDDGVAYIMQISLLSQAQTEQMLRRGSLQARVLDFNLYNFSNVFLDNLEQIRRVEQSSDAYHFQCGDEHVMAMYLLEVTKAAPG